MNKKYNKEEFIGRIIDIMQDCIDNTRGDIIEGRWYDEIYDELVDLIKAWKVFE